MNKLIRHIEYLLSRKDCVIIPGFGAILAQYVEARIDSEHMRIYPPYRTFAFNRDLNQGTDGQLATSISRADSISYEAACQYIRDKVDCLRANLYEFGHIAIGRIGYFTVDRESGAMEFMPFPIDRISTETNSLPAVEHKPADAAMLPKFEIKPYKANVFARAARIAALIAVLIGVYFIASTPISVEKGAMASLAPEIKPISPEALLPADDVPIPTITVIASAHPQDAFIEVDLSKQSQQAQQCAFENNPHRAYVILGSFASLSEANKFKAQHAGIGLMCFERDGRYRLYAESYPTEAEAYAAVHRAQNEFTGAWVYVKR